MDTIGKVQEAIKSFREKKKKDEEEASRLNAATQQKKQSKGKPSLNNPGTSKQVCFNSPIPTGIDAAKGSSDATMEEFDQYVLYDEMRKQTECFQSRKGNTDGTMEEFDQFVIDGELNKQLSEEVEKFNECIVLDLACHAEEPAVVSSREGVLVAQELTSPDNGVPDGQVANIDDSLKIMEIVEETLQDEYESGEQCDSDDDSSPDDEYLFPSPEEVSAAKPPAVGMVFSTLDAAVRFVNVYGKISGFAVIKGRNYKQRKITLQCNMSRQSRPKSILERKRKRNVLGKSNCKMYVRVKLVETKWHITACSLDHNHDLVPSPSLTKFFLSHRTMTEEEMLLSKLLQEIRVKPQRIMTIFRRLKGSFGSIMFGKKKMDNLKQAERKEKQNSDIACALKYIERIQLTKPGFCCKMEVDGSGAVRSLFWTDARSRLDYKLYGEIICFDTTYSTNKYNMPFAPIIGINGHAKTIVFGWALLKDQKADTFQWLFESLVEIMEGKKPKLILTDQDAAIKEAISRVFLDAFHRFCIWHILQNLKENMSAYMAEREGMEETIIGLIMDSLHVLEFESGWKDMVNTYNCGDHAHIKRMWEVRQMFVPAFFKGRFCPFTRSTGRSESFNSNFKDYIMRKDTIENFLKQYELFQESVLEIENEDRFHSTIQNPTFWCHQPIEHHAAKIYTRGIYLKFQTELLNSTAFKVTEVVKDRVFELRKLFFYEKPEYKRELFTVCVDRHNNTYECECGKFDKDGILCCHILRLFTQFDVVEIPGEYIVPRWTNKYREEELLKCKQECIVVHGTNASESALRYAMLMNCVNDVCADLSRDPHKSKLFIEEVQKLHKRLMTGEMEEKKDDDNSVILLDPPVIKKRSRKLPNASEDASVPDSGQANTGNSINVWVNVDGSISKPVEEKRSKAKSPKKRKQQEDGEASTLGDPPVSSSKSVRKGNRLKPQSEKNSIRKKKTK